MSDEGPIKRDYERGFGRNFHLLVFAREDEEEPVAILSEDSSVTVPQEGHKVTISKELSEPVEPSVSEEGDGQLSEPQIGDTTVREEGPFNIDDIEYHYTILEPPKEQQSIEALDEEVIDQVDHPELELPQDTLFAVVLLTVSDVGE